MALFLSQPVTDKISSDTSSGKLIFGSSSMQGWERTHEDAHNCILDYDADTSFFSVYDGHLGRKVALYCSENMPEFLKRTGPYKSGDMKKALEDAFVKLDARIGASTIEMSDEDEASEEERNEDEDDVDSEGSDEENMYDLYEEASMPIEQVMKKYDSKLSYMAEEVEDCSDAVPAKPRESNVYSSASCSGGGGSSQASVVSSSSSRKTEASSSSVDRIGKNESSEISNKPTSPKKRTDSPDSSVSKSDACVHTNKTKPIDSSNQNGEVESSQGSKSNNCEVVTSSSALQENGMVYKKGKGKALMKTKGAKPPKANARPKRSARQLYNKLVDFEEDSDEEEESEDENDRDFLGPNEDSSDDDDEDVNASLNENNSGEDSSSEDDDEVFASNCGCAALVALIRHKDLYVANAGDSRCIVCRNGKAIDLSSVHRPSNKQEYERITKAGGHVSQDGKLHNEIKLSRAIGDFKYKQNKELTDQEQMIIAFPEVKTLTLTAGEDEFMFIACNAVWTCMNNQQIVDLIRTAIRKGDKKLSTICEEILDKCLAKSSSENGTENMTALIVQFKWNSWKRSADDHKESDSSKKIRTDDAVDSTESNIA